MIREARVVGGTVTLKLWQRAEPACPSDTDEVDQGPVAADAGETDFETSADGGPVAPHAVPPRGAYPAAVEEDAAQDEDGIDVAAAQDQRVTMPALSEQEKRALIDAELQQAREEGLEQGRKQGYEQGVADAERERGAQLEQLRTVVSALLETLDSGIAGVEDVAVEIVFEAVSKIIGAHATGRDGVAAIVKSVIGHAKNREGMVIRLSPADYALLEGDASLFESNGDRIKLAADDRVELGGCLLETAGGSLDGRLEIQMQQFRDTLLKVKGNVSRYETE